MIAVMVLDTSVILKWVKDSNEEGVDKARVYLDNFKRKEIEIIVPDLIFYELANFASRQLGETRVEYENLIIDLLCSDIKIIPPDQALMENTVQLASELKVSAYDAAYLALAARFQTKMVTADSKLCSKAKELTIPL